MDNKERFELNDDELDSVVGGVNVGDSVKVDSKMIRYCPGCGKLAMVFTGTVVGKTYYEKGGFYFFDVRSNCCGYVERATEYVCSGN